MNMTYEAEIDMDVTYGNKERNENGQTDGQEVMWMDKQLS
jgi:hypothetical protein